MRFSSGSGVTFVSVGSELHHQELTKKTCEELTKVFNKLLADAKASKEFKFRAEAVAAIMAGVAAMAAEAAANVIDASHPDGCEHHNSIDLFYQLHDVLQDYITKHNQHFYAGN